MYFPDDFARLMALSERAHRLVLRWMSRRWAKRRRLTEHVPSPRRTGGAQPCGTDAAASTVEYRATREAGIGH
jgi:hypothetical protein